MSTPFSRVFELFLPLIADYDLIPMTTAEIELNLGRWLRSASNKFSVDCRQNVLARNFVTQSFSVSLTELEVQILAQLMVVEWLSPRLHATQLIKQAMNDKDFKLYSQSNHIEQLTKLRDAAQKTANSLIMRYSYQGTLARP